MLETLHVYLKRFINLFHLCFQQKIKILYFFQRFKGEKKSHERGPAIRLLTPNGIFGFFLINIFEINSKFDLTNITNVNKIIFFGPKYIILFTFGILQTEFAASTQNPKKIIITPNLPMKTKIFLRKLCFVQ
jgi:hypothetical protein